MQIKSLKLQGFKSFFKETEIMFPQGTSAIVGPNGCGKSNIVDAMRWVLGEQSSKRLRGKNMEEILFNGSVHFPAAGMASVALQLAQKRNGFPHPYSGFEELCVERIYYRTGESEYRINKIPVRLKDIVDLFMDTGTGNRTYSIIEQGYIGEIINASPDQRRLHIEEAAGIVKYKKRKASAIRKMEATTENLRHIEAILFEIKRQMNALNRQAQKARRFQRLKEELKKLECTLALREYHLLSTQESEEKNKKEEKEERITSVIAEHSREEADIEQIQADLLQESNEAEQKQGELLENIQELQKIENKQIYLKQSQEDLLIKTEENKKQLSLTKEQLAQTDLEKKDLSVRSLELSRREKWVETILKGEKEKYETLISEEKQFGEKIEAVKQDLFVCMTQKAECHNKQLSIQEKRKDLEQRRIKDEQEIRILQEENENFFINRRGQEDTLKERKRKRGILLLERTALEVYRKELKQEFNNFSEEKDHLQGGLNKKRSRLFSLQELQESYEGYQDGVRAIMTKKRKEAESKKGIRGMVADVIEPQPEFETAVESILGDKLQYIIVEEQQDGLQAIQYLKTQTLGRGSFIPLQLRGSQGEEHSSESPGVSLMDVVKVKSGYQEVAEYLLGDSILVSDLQEGLTLWKNNGHHKRIVTKEGDMIDPYGVISGGKTNGSGSTFLKAKREIRELQAEVEGLNKELQNKKDVCEQYLRKIRINEADLEKLQQDLYQQDMEILKVEKDAQQLSESLKRNQQRLHLLDVETSQFEKELKGWDEEEENFIEQERELSEIQVSKENMLSQLNREIQESTVNKDLQRDELKEMEIEVQLIREKRSGLLSYERQLDQKVQTIQSFLLEKEKECMEAGLKMASIEEELTANEKNSGQFEQAKLALEKVLVGMNESIDEKKSVLQHKETIVKDLKKSEEEIRRLLDAIQIKLVEMQLKKNNIQEKMQEKHRVDIAGEEDFEVSDEEDTEIRQSLDKIIVDLERIGEVNPTAIEEFESLQKRHLFYQEQYEDLKNSLESLQRLIQRINKISKARFLEAFEQINDNFQQTFPRLFNGGRAFLELVDGKDPLESGVEIAAQPPGKKLQNINLLSGGEKTMAALSLILAIFQYKPSPFCILDEVDAALDDVNVHRFNEIVKDISQVAQFILITHNKQTMGIANSLYGITMESPGVSQVVSVQIH